MASILSTDVWVPGNMTPSPTPLCGAPESTIPRGEDFLLPLLTTLIRTSLTEFPFSTFSLELSSLSTTGPWPSFSPQHLQALPVLPPYAHFLKSWTLGQTLSSFLRALLFAVSTAIKVVTHYSVTSRDRGCAVWECMPGTFKQPGGRERSKYKYTWREKGGGQGGGVRDFVIFLPESLGCFFSSHFSSSPQFTFISLWYSSQNTEPRLLSPCSFLPGLFALATSSSTPVVYLDIWVCCYFYEKESEHSALPNSKTRKVFCALKSRWLLQ